MKFTINTGDNGKILVRTMSEKAQRGYDIDRPFTTIYELNGCYAIKDLDGLRDNMTREQVEKWFEGVADMFDNL